MTAEELEKTVAILEKVARHFPADSEESKAVELGAWALHFAFHVKTTDAFGKFLNQLNQPLTEAQTLYLRAVEFDPDALTDVSDERE